MSTAALHGQLTPWKPGQSGNPLGISKAKRVVRDLAVKNCARSMEVIIELMETAEDERVRLAAAIEVKNTAIGKPRVRDLTKEEIEAEVDKRIRALAQQANEMRRAGALDVTPTGK